MTGPDLAQALETLGVSQSAAARALGVHHSTVWRAIQRPGPIEGQTAACVRCWLQLQAAGLPLPWEAS